MTGKIKLYTSLPPNITRTIGDAEVGVAYLAECIGSWRRAGFDVVSLNGASEIGSVGRQGYDVECRSISRDRPSIDDFLDAIRGSQAPIAGIINADVILMAEPELLKLAVDDSGMTLMERINIDPNSLRPTGRSCYGFDAFIFSTEPLSHLDQGEEFLFGHPWWDYWFPFAYAAAGGRLNLVQAPVLFHLQHPLKWKHEHHLRNARKTARCLLRLGSRLPDDLMAYMRKLPHPEDMSEAQLGHFGSLCFAKIRSMAEPIGLRPSARDQRPLRRLTELLDDPVNRAWIGELDAAEGRVLAAAESLSRKVVLLQFWSLNVAAFKRRYETSIAVVKAAAETLAAIARRAWGAVLGLRTGLPR